MGRILRSLTPGSDILRTHEARGVETGLRSGIKKSDAGKFQDKATLADLQGCTRLKLCKKDANAGGR